MDQETPRKMAYIAEITDIFPIDGADRIVQYEIDNGWKVIDQKDKYVVGDAVVYFAIDSWVPSAVAPFLTKPEHFPKVYNGVQGEKLRTIRLKGAYSQGLIHDCSILSEYDGMFTIGSDMSGFLQIVRWEAPEENLSADAKGSFPLFLFKSDQGRIQNTYRSLKKELDNGTWSMSEKIEGQSFTAYIKDGVFGVCSRNLELKDSDNTFWNTVRKYDLEAKMRKVDKNFSIVGEQYGSSISGNIYWMNDVKLMVYDIFDIDEVRYFNPVEKSAMIIELGLTSVPVLNANVSLKGKSLSDILELADGKSALPFANTLREGLVFNLNANKRVSFKAISNKYLLKQIDF